MVATATACVVAAGSFLIGLDSAIAWPVVRLFFAAVVARPVTAVELVVVRASITKEQVASFSTRSATITTTSQRFIIVRPSYSTTIAPSSATPSSVVVPPSTPNRPLQMHHLYFTIVYLARIGFGPISRSLTYSEVRL